jgi:hypothetical protein
VPIAEPVWMFMKRKIVPEHANGAIGRIGAGRIPHPSERPMIPSAMPLMISR